MFRVIASAPMSLLSAVTLCGCTASARLYPTDPAARAAGVPQVHYTDFGLGSGPVTVTMADGEELTGHFEVMDNGAFAIASSGRRLMTAYMGSGVNHVSMAASGPRTTMLCEGAANLMGHGTGGCETTDGAHYRITY